MTALLRVSLLATCLAVFAATLLAGAATGSQSQRDPPIDAADAELAAALERRDSQTASRLLIRAFGQPLGLPAGHAAAALLGPAAINDLPAMLAADGGDEAAAARVNNLGVSLALRGWFRSAGVCFGRAITRRGDWSSVLDRRNGRPTIREYQFHRPAGGGNPVALNVRNLERLVGLPARAAPTQLEDWMEVRGSSLRHQLQAMAEIFPPFASAAFMEMSRGGDPGREYQRIAAYKGRFLRTIRHSTERFRVAARAANQGSSPGEATADPALQPAAATGKKFDFAAEAARERALEQALQASGIHGRTGREWWQYDQAYPVRPQGALRAGEAFIDIYLVEFATGGAELRREYVGVVVSPAAGARSISLGAAPEVDAIIDELRTAMTGQQRAAVRPPDSRGLDVKRHGTDASNISALEAAGRRLWRPLRDALPAGTSRVWLALDGRLSEVPWQSLIVLADATPRHLITLVDSAMGLLERRSPSSSTPSRRVLLLGDVDYGPPIQSRLATEALSALPGTSIEIAAIKALAQQQGLEAIELKGAGATESAIVKALPASIVHLATHGRFRAAGFRPRALSVGSWVVLDPDLRVQTSVLGNAGTAGRTPEEQMRLMKDALEAAARKARQSGPVAGPTTDLEVVAQGALALAGANAVKDAFATGSDSFLTDVDFARLDLSDTDLVVLAACDLGQFEQEAFQGLASMQSAVIVARARTVVSSLWRVPDAETAEFMRLFYENLLVAKLPKAEALHAAQKAMSVGPDGKPRSPFFWAGWTMTGEGW